MRLLVSVRSGDEVAAALRGGADIVDAKEPGRGSLGQVSTGTLKEIISRIPVDAAASVALGEVGSPDEAGATLTALPRIPRLGPIYLKLGFAGIELPGRVQTILSAAVRTAARLPGNFTVVAVAYADWERAQSLPPTLVCQAAHRAGAAGVLLDTREKDGRGLFHWINLPELSRWVASVRQRGLLTALAGELRAETVPLAARSAPDVIGIRGAACTGGRTGSVVAARVRAIRSALVLSGSIQGQDSLSRNA